MTTDEDSFDTELFIAEVHKLPCIWNYTSDEYTNKMEKARAWESLCFKFYNKFELKNKKDKNECIVKLQRKWKSLRDSYNRELKKDPGSGGPKRRRYIYFNDLSYLKPMTDRRAAESPNSICSLEQNDDEQDFTTSVSPTKRKVAPIESKTTPTEIKTTPVERKTSPIIRKLLRAKDKDEESELITKLSSRLSDRLNKEALPNRLCQEDVSKRLCKEDDRAEHTDSDFHFLMSLHDRFKSIDNAYKIDAQIEILSVIQKYSQPRTCISNNKTLGRRSNAKLSKHPVSSNARHVDQIKLVHLKMPPVNSLDVSEDVQILVSPQSFSNESTDEENILSK